MRWKNLIIVLTAIVCGMLGLPTTAARAETVPAAALADTAAVADPPVSEPVLPESDCCQPLPLERSAAAEAAARIAAECRTGSLLFSRGDCLAVRIYTGSGFTHVATVVQTPAGPMVYDSMNGTGVRKLTLEDYLVTQAPDEVHLYHPRREFTEPERVSYEYALESHLGRPYSVKHHLTGRPNAGLHCSEYLTQALMDIDWLRAENPVRVSPASLRKGILESNLYETGTIILIPRPQVAQVAATTWYGWAWSGTKSCTLGTCRKLSRWFLCR